MTLFETGIRPHIDAHIKKRSEERRDYGEYWSASSAGYCMRLNILKRLNVPSVPEIADDALRTQRVFESGHVFHEYMQRITKEAGLSIAQELELQDEGLMVRGHIDDLVFLHGQGCQLCVDGILEDDHFHTPSDHLILYDYKTQNSQAFNYHRPQMNHSHKMQLGTYMYMLRKRPIVGIGGTEDAPTAKLTELTEARILQISKDDLRMREQQLFWSLELEAEVNAYWGTLNGYWKSKTLPPCTCLDHDGGFMGKRSKKGKVYNPYFYNEKPCSLEWVEQFEEAKEFFK